MSDEEAGWEQVLLSEMGMTLPSPSRKILVVIMGKEMKILLG
jgi:hypothetical protein